MPRVLLLDGFEFFFYSNERNEPMHVHVGKAQGIGKIWIEPYISICYAYGFTPNEIRRILKIVEENKELFKIKWNEYFKK
jgi:hypothetical protein